MTLSVSIPNLVLYFKRVIQEIFCLLTKKNSPLIVIKAESIPTGAYLDIYVIGLVNLRNYKIAQIYI